MMQEKKPLQRIAEIKPEDIHNYAILLDIDGVVCEPQQPMTSDMAKVINLLHYKLGGHVYYVTGNTYTKAVDLVGGGKIFCNGADELREDGRCLWRDDVTPVLPNIQDHLDDWQEHKYRKNNCIEWRTQRQVNYSYVGRYASQEERAATFVGWRDAFMADTMSCYPGVECSIGGQVSVDIYSRGADKSRAGKWINETLGKPFIFIGDKTSPGGNDYPLVKYCEDNGTFSNIALTTSGTQETMSMLDKIYRML